MQKSIKIILTFVFTLFIGIVGFGIWQFAASHSSKYYIPEQDNNTSKLTSNSALNGVETVSDAIEMIKCPNPDSSKHLLSYQNRAVSMGIVNLRVICGNLPDYPTELRNKNISGIVSVFLHINEMGEVSNIFSSSGNSKLRRLAEKAAYRTKISPLIIKGKAYRTFGNVIYEFNSERGVWLINPVSPKYPYGTV